MPKTVLISPLDWGLGHATRMVPVIKYFIAKGENVVIGGNGKSIEWLKERFPNLTYEYIPGYEVNYSNKIGFLLKMLLSIPKIFFGILAERKASKKLHRKHQFDLVLSDGRFGVHVSGIPNYIVSHQINIKFPGLEKQVFSAQKKLLQRFTALLIPDFVEEIKLAGELSALKPAQKVGIPVHYIGTLSRFEQSVNQAENKYKYAGVVSGPEPYRTLFTNLLINEFSKIKEPCIVLTYDYPVVPTPKNLQLILDPSDDEFLHYISLSETVISRSGYTTLMDLVVLQKNAFFVPTPGQTEQEYLAVYATQNSWSNHCSQAEFSIDKVKYSSHKLPENTNSLTSILDNIFSNSK